MASLPPALPLAGQRVVVTRPLHQASELCELLEARGAQVLQIPVLEIQPPADSAPLDAALRCLGDYPWILFTSANAVECTLRRLSELGLPGLAEAAIASKFCAIGPATARALEAAGCPVDLVPEEYIAESVVEAFAPVPLAGVRVLIPRAAAARDLVPDALRERGAMVDAVEAYRSGVPANAAARVAEICAARTPIQWVTFTSGSTVKNFLAVGGASLLAATRIATIGPATSEVARKHGLGVDAEATPHTAIGLVDAICHAARP